MPRPSPQRRTPRQRVTPIQDRARRRLDAILDAAAALLTEHGTEHVSMLAIAEAAGTTPATVYHYFDNRMAVFAALARRTMAAVDGALTEQLTAFAGSTEVGTRALLDLLYQAYRDTPGYAALLRALRAEPALQEVVRESNQRMADVIAEVLVSRTRLPRTRAGRVGWILSELCELAVEAALMAEPPEAEALMAEMTEMMDVLFGHYLAQA